MYYFTLSVQLLTGKTMLAYPVAHVNYFNNPSFIVNELNPRDPSGNVGWTDKRISVQDYNHWDAIGNHKIQSIDFGVDVIDIYPFSTIGAAINNTAGGMQALLSYENASYEGNYNFGTTFGSSYPGFTNSIFWMYTCIALKYGDEL